MKKLIITFLLILFFPFASFSQDFINVVNNEGKIVGQIPTEQFYALVRASEYAYREVKAEEAGRLRIKLKEEVYNVKVGETFESSFDIEWYDENGNVFKVIPITHKVKVRKEAMSQIRIIYRDVSEITAPISTIIAIILFIILL